jgi:hypothetical protein
MGWLHAHERADVILEIDMPAARVGILLARLAGLTG